MDSGRAPLVYNAPMSAHAVSIPDDVSGAERRFRDLLDGLSEMLFEFDLSGRFVYVNQSGLDAFGYTAEDVARGVSVADVVVPEQRENLRQNIARRTSTGPHAVSEYTALRKDGSTFPALVHTSIVMKDGRLVGLRGYLIDISERVRAEDALRHRIALEQLIMGVSTQLMAAPPAETDACIESALASIGHFMGVDRSYIFLFSPHGRLMSNTHEWVAEGISAERQNLQRISVDTTFPWFAEELRRHFVVPVPVVADLPAEAAAERAEFQRQGIRSLINVAMVRGGTLGGFLGLDVVRGARSWSADETALLRILGEIFMGAIVRRRAEVAVQESERKYKALVETTSTGFVILDQQGCVLDANAEYVRMTGRRSLDEIRGRSVVEWTAPHDLQRNAAAVRSCMQHGFVRGLQIEYQHPTGVVVPVLINATGTEEEGTRQIITIVRDMSDRKRLEDELLRSEKLQSLGVMAGGIAHDFNNILTAILGNISLLRASLKPDGPSRELLAEAETASLQARDLTRQLLTFSRGGAPVRKLFKPDSLIREFAGLALRGRATAREIEIADDLWPVEADEGQLGQVLNNLIINASQAMQNEGTVNITAENRHVRESEVPALAAGEYVAISVADHGTGIPEEHRTRVFDPYFTTKAEGRGLGLAVSYSIVVSHGGAIILDSEVGRGTTFTVYLPGARGASLTPQPDEPEIVRGTGRVLVMDDEALVRDIAGKIIRSLGYEVAFARDGQEAIDVWNKARVEGQPFDVVVMDLTIPGGMGGRQAIRELLAIDPAARAVVSSGYSQDPIMANYREYGFRDVIAKPYSVVDMSRTLAAVVRSG
jgi:PAS domain S-box-containing protein